MFKLKYANLTSKTSKRYVGSRVSCARGASWGSIFYKKSAFNNIPFCTKTMTSQTVFEFFFNYLRFLGFLVYVSFAAALAAALEAAFLPCLVYLTLIFKVRFSTN